MKKWYSLLVAIINIILYLVLIALWISIPEVLSLNISLTIFNLILTLIWIYLNRQALSLYYKGEQFNKLVETGIFLFLIFCLLGVANYWAYKHPVQKDLSAFKLNSLSDQTKNILKNMKGEVHFKLFARKQESLVWIALIEYYRALKNDLVISKIDIDVRPDLVADYQITDKSTLVIEYNGKRQSVVERDELNITNALIKVSRKSDPVVYFILGHQEADIESKETEGLKFIFEAMIHSAVDVRPLNLLSIKEIPADAKAIIIWGPKTDFMPNEILTLNNYLAGNGNLLVALDPQLNKDPVPALRKYLENYRISIKNNLVIDKKSFVNGSNGSIPMINVFNQEHPITAKFKGQVFFPLVSSVEEMAKAPNLKNGKISFLFNSSDFPDSWGETDILEFTQQGAIFTAEKDLPGPLNLAIAFEGDRNKIVAFANSSFVLNAYLKFGANYALFLNSLSWLVDEDRLISFNLPIVQSEPIFISAPQLGIIFYFSVLFSPLILFGVAIYMYRRKRGR